MRAKLNNGKRTQGANDAAGRHCVPRLQDTPVAPDEKQIDWEAHGKSVNEIRGRNNQRVTLGERRTPQQPAFSRRGIKGGLQSRGNWQPRSLVAQNERARIRPKKRRQKMRFQTALFSEDPAG